jgi:hypothetical protein
LPAAPNFTDVKLADPIPLPDMPTLADIPPVDAGSMPVSNLTPFSVDSVQTPSSGFPSAPGTVAVNTALSFPAAPSLLAPPELTLPVHTVPVAPQTVVPEFDAQRPVSNLSAPSDLAGQMSAAYRNAAPTFITMIEGYVDAMLVKYNPRYHEQMARIEDQLAKYLNGGTALNPSVETAIYERARSKNAAEAQRVRDAAYKQACDRGFTLPPGSLASALQTARQSSADLNAAAAREIVVAQAEMEQKNLQFAVTTSAGLRTALLNATLSYQQNLISLNGQAVDFAKAILNAIVETYNISVRVFEAQLEAYKADAVVYEARLRAAMAGIEVYKAEVQALEALTNVDRAQVEVYRARIESMGALVNVYRAQIDAVLGRVSMEKLKVEVFQAQVQAYSAQVQAKSAEWQGYAAAMEGQAAKARIFVAQAEGYTAQVQGYRAQIEGKVAVTQAAATNNRAQLEAFAAHMSAYKSDIEAKGEKAKYEVANQSQRVNAYQVAAHAAEAQAQMNAEYYRANAQTTLGTSEMKLRAMIEEGNSRRAFSESLARLGTGTAQVYANLAGAAMSGVNALAAETYQGS